MLKFSFYTALGITVLLAVCYFWVSQAASGSTYDKVKDLPQHKAAILLGTSKFIAGGQLNRFYANRIEAAAKLYHSGKVEYIIVSGDNRAHSYNEPKSMRRDLLEKGVPAKAIVADYAGFRTLDSMIRSKLIFGQDSIIVVSQRFHNERAVFIARHHDIAAVGFNAADVDRFYGFRTMLRETFARVKVMFDLYILNTKPRFLGPEIPIE